MKKKTENKEETAPSLSNEDAEKLVIDMGKQGITAEKIGLKLKQDYNIKAKISGIDIGKILKKNNLFQDPDITNLKKRVEMLKKHVEKNKKDQKTKRTLNIKNAKLGKLGKFRAR
ncbi:hypothetical protein HYW76_04820 [Candidatus Pacearchaeota archaeon]|nr:hypothetical protein [Candidatus Pacearchaeota archaeon]